MVWVGEDSSVVCCVMGFVNGSKCAICHDGLDGGVCLDVQGT